MLMVFGIHCHKHQWHRSVHITGIRATSINGTGQSTSPVLVPRASMTPVSPHHRYSCHEHQRHRSVHITGTCTTSINDTGQSTPVSPHHRYPYHEHQRHRSVHITGRLIGWLVFNGTFSTKKLYCAMQNVKVW